MTAELYRGRDERHTNVGVLRRTRPVTYRTIGLSVSFHSTGIVSGR